MRIALTSPPATETPPGQPAPSGLVRLLAPWARGAEAAGNVDLAQRLAPWVGAFEAIELQAAHRAVRAVEARAARDTPPAAPLAAAFEQARGTLARALTQDAALPHETTYTPYKRRHLELQRQMEQVIGALREHVRETLGRMALPLRRLALLDAAMEKLVARREQALLPVAVGLLERRFEQLRRAHAKAAPEEDDPIAWRRPGGWLHTFEHDWHQALQAELALRLEPVAGLIEAAGIELNHHA